MESSDMRVLVSGASGQIGTRLVERLHLLGFEVACLTRDEAEVPGAIVRWFPWVWGSSRLMDLGLNDVGAVFHLAAQTSAYVARNAPSTDAREAVVGFVDLLEQLRSQQDPPFVVLAGAATQVGALSGRITEGHQLSPTTFYDVAKTSQELYLRQFIAEEWVNGCTLRLSNVYGGEASHTSPHRGFVNRAVEEALDGKALHYFEGSEMLRDFVHVDDAVEAFLSVFRRRTALRSSEFMVGTGIGTSIRSMLEMVAASVSRNAGLGVEVLPVETPSGIYPIEMRNVTVDHSLITKETGWRPRITLPAGVEACVRQAIARRQPKS